MLDYQGIRAVLFDFDGTIFRLFVNYNLNMVSRKISNALRMMSINFDSRLDPFEVFNSISIDSSLSYEEKRKALCTADLILTESEVDALDSGLMVTNANTLLSELIRSKKPIGIATNNSEKCVREYLHRICPSLEQYVPIYGRIAEHPELMKPNPRTITLAAGALGFSSEDCLYVGDTKRDYEASNIAGCRFIGMAPTMRKKQQLLEFLAEDAIVNDFFELKSKIKCICSI